MTLDTQPELVERSCPFIPTPNMIAAAWTTIEQQSGGIKKLGPGLGVREIWQAMWQAADALERALPISCEDELRELRAERDALLQEPIDLAKMDSIDDDAADKMVAYYWWQQAKEARALIAAMRLQVERE